MKQQCRAPHTPAHARQVVCPRIGETRESRHARVAGTPHSCVRACVRFALSSCALSLYRCSARAVKVYGCWRRTALCIALLTGERGRSCSAAMLLRSLARGSTSSVAQHRLLGVATPLLRCHASHHLPLFLSPPSMRHSRGPCSLYFTKRVPACSLAHPRCSRVACTPLPSPPFPTPSCPFPCRLRRAPRFFT